jgi:signal transduction histidine kinase
MTDPAVTTREVARLEEELRRSETRFRDVIERNADAIVVVDGTGEICFANEAAAALFGQSVRSLERHPFGFPMVVGETTELDVFRDGESLVVEMRVVESEWEGEHAFIATLRDATDRKRAEETARRLIAEQAARNAADKATQRFRFLADASAALAGSLDYRGMLALLPKLCASEIADWTIMYRVDNGVLEIADSAHCRPESEELLEELRIYSSNTSLLAPIVAGIRARRPVLIREVTEEWLQEHVPDPGQRALIDRLGLASLMLVPLIARDHLLGAVALASADPARLFGEEDLALAHDLASRAALALDNARLYNDAKDANQTKTDFLAVISHDLRTPLNAILGYSDLLLLGIPDTLADGATESVRRVRTAATHLVYLIDELLSYARLESRHEVLHFSDAVVQRIADEVTAVIQPLADGRSLKFIVDMPAEPLTLETDPDKLRQALLNLVSNAVKYTDDGEVRLSAGQTESDDIVITVSDSGIGIAEENLQRIFDPFWQVSEAQRGPSTGTGLGLSVVRELVQQLGGEITVRSVLGDGSIFTLTIPRRRRAAAEIAESV